MINAEEFSRAGKKYIGTPYEKMDCQKFYEQCLRDCGLSMDLKGANAWYRKFLNTGWVGSPEDCKAKFGSIPKGATLFIHAYDGGEEKRGYHDGLGNASHIGTKTGTGKGAIHSSETAGGVAESPFNDKTIRNGGWNTVGLSTMFDYGDKVNRILGGGDSGDDDGDDAPPWDDPTEDPGEGDEMPEIRKATVFSENGKPVRMRASKTTPKTGKALYDELPVGTVVEVIGSSGEWSKVNYEKRSGWWIKTEFLVFDDDDTAEDPELPDPEDGDDIQPGDMVIIRLNAENATHFLTLIDLVKDQIIEQIGRG